MKTLGILTFMVLYSTFGFSQDTLYTKEGQTINGKVTEVTQDQIKYKKASNPDGPSYVISTSDVVLIHYKNGSKDVFQNQQNSSGNAATANSNQNNNGYADPVYVNTRPNVNVVVGGAPYIAYTPFWGGWWGGWGWGGYYRRPYYYGGGYYHHGYHGGYHQGGGHYGHYGHHR